MGVDNEKGASRRGDMTLRLTLGDCIEKMRDIPERSIGAVICDPPYG